MAFVEVTKKDHIAVVTMNRPEALNALNKAVFTDLEVALDDVEKDDEVYVVIITGAGRAFIAGADIGEMAPMNVAEGLAFSELGNRILMRVDMMEKPTIAAVNGFALGGGCEMALACDIRIASEKAKFGQPEVGLGIIPGFGGTQRMARIIGTGPAMELIYTADTIDAQRPGFRHLLRHRGPEGRHAGFPGEEKGKALQEQVSFSLPLLFSVSSRGEGQPIVF